MNSRISRRKLASLEWRTIGQTVSGVQAQMAVSRRKNTRSLREIRNSVSRFIGACCAEPALPAQLSVASGMNGRHIRYSALRRPATSWRFLQLNRGDDSHLLAFTQGSAEKHCGRGGT